MLAVGTTVESVVGGVVIVSDGRVVGGGVVVVGGSVVLLIGGGGSMVVEGIGGVVVSMPVVGGRVVVGSTTVVGSATVVGTGVDSMEDSLVTVGRMVVGWAVVGSTVTGSVVFGARAVVGSDKALLRIDEMPARGSTDVVGVTVLVGVTSPVGASRMPLELEETVEVGVAGASDEATAVELVVGGITVSGSPPVDEATLEGSDDVETTLEGSDDVEVSDGGGTTIVLETTMVVLSLLESEVGPLEELRLSPMLERMSPRFWRFVELAGTTTGVDCDVEDSRLVVVTLKNWRLTLRGK